MVNGEVCIGLFSIRNIKKGEEVTFDYNYVRVFGAAAKKCVCGSPNCRGYIGGDPTNSEVIVQDDSDDQYTEPVMICEDRELNEEWNDIISSSLKSEENEFMLEPTENRCNMEKWLGRVGETFAGSQALDSLTPKVEDPAQVAGTVVEVDNSFGNGLVEQSEINKERGKSLNGSVIGNLKAKSDDLQSRMSSSELMHISLDTDGSLNKELSSAHESVVTVASPSKSPSDAVESKRKLKYATVGVRDGVSKSKPVARTKRYSNSVRKGKPKVNAMNDKESSDMDKINGTLHKAKKLPGLSISHFEADEEKLNELLDPEGGISRRKGCAVGMRLVGVVVAGSVEGNGHGGWVTGGGGVSRWSGEDEWKLDMKNLFGEAICRICQESFSTNVTDDILNSSLCILALLGFNISLGMVIYQLFSSSSLLVLVVTALGVTNLGVTFDVSMTLYCLKFLVVDIS